MQSRYITDVIVTSNSNEILSLGRQMGTLTRKRKQELCNIKVSLDSVVWDVFEQLNINDYDYIVTMQSISPTLKVKTLDAAFEEIANTMNNKTIQMFNNFFINLLPLISDSLIFLKFLLV